MEIGKMMMGGKSEGQYAYYAFKPEPTLTDEPKSDRSLSINQIILSTNEGTLLTLYYSDAIKSNTSGTGFVPVSPSTFVIQGASGQAAPTQLVGKYVTTVSNIVYRITSVDGIDSFYNSHNDTIVYYLKCNYQLVGVSIGATKYGVTGNSDKYTARTLGDDGFVYAKITGQTTV